MVLHGHCTFRCLGAAVIVAVGLWTLAWSEVSFAPQVRYDVRDGPYSVVAADFDSDGFDDIAAVNRWSNNVTVLLNNGDGTFASGRHYRVGGSPAFAATADLDGDADVDLVIVDTEWDHINPVEGSITVLLGHGDGTFKRDRTYRVGVYPRQVAVADFNLDGVLDLVVGNGESGDLSFLEGNGDGRFAQELRTPYAFNSPHILSAGDFNQDGVPDLGVSRIRGYHVRVLLGNGDGTFLATVGAGVQQHIYSHVVVDLNADGLDDVAVVNEGPVLPSYPGVVTIVEGRAGFLWVGEDFGIGDEQAYVRAGDLSGDLVPDLVTANVFTGDVSILIGRGDFEFDPEIRLTVGQGPESVAVGDFTGDGRGSLVVANRNDDDVSVFLNTGPVPPSPPVADAGSDQLIQAASPAGATVTLDGSGSTDSDSTPGTNDDIVLFEWIDDLGGPAESPLGTGEMLQALLAIGSHTITLRVTDSTLLDDTDELLVTVTDVVPPDLTLEVSPSVLWPPNHRMVEAWVTMHPGPSCTTPLAILESVVSSEPDDAPGGSDGDTEGDIQDAAIGTQDLTLRLRAERDGSGPGRVYTLLYAVSCEPGNESPVSLEVTVPHNQSGVIEPVQISLEESVAGTLVSWGPVTGAVGYDVIRGPLDALTVMPSRYDLGPVVCIEASSTDANTSGFEDAAVPVPGGAFFYLVQYQEAADSGYGTESAAKPRAPSDGDCF